MTARKQPKKKLPARRQQRASELITASSALPGRLSAHGYRPPADLSLPRYLEVMATLSAIGEGFQYWIGDALNFGEARYGEKYASAVSPEQAQTWRHYAYIARHVPEAIRARVPTFSHSKVLASVPGPEQLKWAERVGKESLSVAQLQAAIQAKAVVPKVRVALAKAPRIAVRKNLAAAAGESCIRCDAQDGTVVAAYFSGKYSDQLGAGAGTKAHDFCVADLCHDCHQHFDGYADGNDDARAAEFMLCVLKTIARRWTDGLIGWIGKPA